MERIREICETDGPDSPHGLPSVLPNPGTSDLVTVKLPSSRPRIRGREFTGRCNSALRVVRSALEAEAVLDSLHLPRDGALGQSASSAAW